MMAGNGSAATRGHSKRAANAGTRGAPHLDRRLLIEVALLMLALAVLLTYPLISVMGEALPFNLGDPLLNAWILGWTSDRLVHGLDGLWSPPVLHPHTNTLAFSEHLLGVSLLLAPIYWITRNGILLHNIAILLSFVIAGVGMFVLAFDLTRRRDAALVAALLFAFTPMRLGGELARVQMMMSCWLPLAFCGLHRYGATGAPRFLAAATAGYLLLALSNVYLGVYAVPALAIIGLAALQRINRDTVRHLLVAAAVTAAILGPIALQYADAQKTYGLTRSVAEIEQYSADVMSYIAVAPTSPMGGLLPVERTADRALYPGILVIVLALVALAPTRWIRGTNPNPRLLVAYVATAAVAFVLSLGPTLRVDAGGWPGIPGPYSWLMSHVPAFTGLRAPGRFGMIVVLALAVLAAAGAARVLASRGRVFRGAFIGLVLVIVVAEGYGGRLRMAPLDRALTSADRAAYAWLAAAPAGVVFELPTEQSAWRLAGAGATPSLVYQYMSLQHGKPLINGHSGYTPRLMAVFQSDQSPWLEPARMHEGLETVYELGARYIVVHGEAYWRQRLPLDIRDVLRASGLVTAEHAFGHTTVFVLREPEESGLGS